MVQSSRPFPGLIATAEVPKPCSSGLSLGIHLDLIHLPCCRLFSRSRHLARAQLETCLALSWRSWCWPHTRGARRLLHIHGRDDAQPAHAPRAWSVNFQEQRYIRQSMPIPKLKAHRLAAGSYGRSEHVAVHVHQLGGVSSQDICH